MGSLLQARQGGTGAVGQGAHPVGMAVVLLLLLGGSAGASAQLMEPLSYTNAPVGLNFFSVGYGHLWGDVLVDPSLPVKDVNARVDTAVLNYARVADFFGQSGTFSLVVPYAWLGASGEVAGQSRTVDRTGLTDISMRVSVNLAGAPALSLREFGAYRQDTIVGISVLMTAPTGHYDADRLINIGTNRWSFRPEVGVSKAIGRWTLEAAIGVTLFTDNDDFLGGNTRTQEPLYGLQAHVIYQFDVSRWASLDATAYAGGQTAVNGTVNDDRQNNTRWGASFSQAFSRNSSVKAYFSSGATARFGTNFTAVGIAWQYRWGGGL